MALPNLSHADLEKLKIFINFVSENPTVLNLPQLQFVKEFVEKFGGKVPPGEFKMPAGAAGGKCPFGGDAGTANDGASGMNVDESEESDLEESEPESEVELNMEAKTKTKRKRQKKELDWTPPSTSYENFINTNTVYMGDTKEAKKAQKSIKTEHEHSAESDMDQDDKEEYECPVEAVYGTDAEDDNIDEDPIKTNIASVAMKCEIDSDVDNDVDNDIQDENYKEDDNDKGSESSDSDVVAPVRRQTRSSRRIARAKKGKRGRKSRKILSEYEPRKKIRRPRPANCLEKCKKQCAKIDQEQRMKLCKEFWALDFVERKNHLLTCVQRMPLGKMRIINRVKESRQHTNHYFLTTSSGERVRVCLSFFLKTLVISNFLVKSALENTDDQGKFTGIDLRGGSGEGRRLKTEMAKQRRQNSADVGNSSKNSISESTDEQKSPSNMEDDLNKPEVLDVKNLETLKPIEREEPTNLSEAEEQAKPTEPVELTLAKPVETAAAEFSALTIDANKTMEDLATPPTRPKPPGRKPKSENSTPRRRRSEQRIRVPQPVNCAEICRFKCHTKFTEEQRVQLCAAFWRLGYKRRKDFVLSRVEVHENTTTTAAEYRKSNRVRTFTNRYFLRGQRGENVRVCSRFFFATLCVGNHFLANAQKNVDKQTGAYAGEDMRGRATPKNKIPLELVRDVHQHINSYPTWVPCKSYKTRYLHSSLNIVKMYGEYKEEMERLNKPAVSGSFFRRIFHKDFKLAFLQAKSKHAHKVSAQRSNSSATSAVIPTSSTCAKVDDPVVISSNITITTATGPSLGKKTNPNISDFTGEEGGFWTQLTPNATETMKFLQQRYAPQAATAVIMQPLYIHQQQQQQQQQLQQQQLQQQLQQQQVAPAPQPATLPAAAYHLPQAISYVHQPHIMNAGYESEERAQNFHML
ncbi:PREDICTED: uncharacterized protein LOC108374795 isoform X1 [Rhagoletis zephyria]|uniref:uncharacterized protein LOC108374795 isoform X1 n=1 Tax=Rhagoletis zephyria TaxID=28612 RepID=UPI0008112B0F|nr:PREDICTED: uncharacterized protein LOC108374795 isoform X1 [Rhagoletis zephyria]